MKRIGMLIAFFAVLAILLPLTAQDAKKDADKKETDKKSDAKKDPDKKDKKEKEKLVYGVKFVTKIVNMKGETNREYTIEIQEKDPAKVQAVANWSAQRQAALAQELFNLNRIDPKDVQGRFNATQNYQKNVANYQIELAKQNVFSTKNVDVRAAENAKVRANVLPIEFDDQGFQKKWTKKEIEERKDKSGLPGYFASEFDAIKPGQYVEIYMAKVMPKKKDDKKKKGPDDDDPPAAKDRANEFVLIVILGDTKK